MTNFEYYKDEIKKYIDNMANFTVSKGKIIDCDDDRCGHCEINDSTYSPCEIGRIKWLYEEHKETQRAYGSGEDRKERSQQARRQEERHVARPHGQCT